MKRLEEFQDKRLENLKVIKGGCERTSYLTTNGTRGTDTWCDSNGNGKMDKGEIKYDKVASLTAE